MDVPIQINHTILAADDRTAAAEFLARVLGLSTPTQWGPFATVDLGDGAHVHFAEPPNVDDIQKQHIAFKVDDERFDQVYGRVRELGLDHWADPARRLPGRINTNHGGRGFYFLDATGHYLEVLTRSELDA